MSLCEQMWNREIPVALGDQCDEINQQLKSAALYICTTCGGKVEVSVQNDECGCGGVLTRIY